MISTSSSPWTPRLLWLWLPELLGSAAWWYVVSHVLAGRVRFFEASPVLVILLGLMGLVGLGWWVGTLLFGAALLPWRSWRLLSTFLSSLTIWIFLPFAVWTAVAWAIILIGLMIGVEQAYDHAHNNLMIRVRQVIATSLSAPLIMIFIGTSLLYFQHLQTSTASPDVLANNVVAQSATTVERIIPKIRSGYRVGMTVDELLGLFIPSSDDVLKGITPPNGKLTPEQQNQVKQSLSDRGVPVENLQLDFNQSEAQLQQAIDQQIVEFRSQIIGNLRTQLSQSLRIDLQGDETVQAALQSYFNRQFNIYVRAYVKWLPPLLALTLFFTLQLISIFFQWGIIFVGWTWYRLLRLTRVLGVTHETVPAERLNWTG